MSGSPPMGRAVLGAIFMVPKPKNYVPTPCFSTPVHSVETYSPKTQKRWHRPYFAPIGHTTKRPKIMEFHVDL